MVGVGCREQDLEMSEQNHWRELLQVDVLQGDIVLKSSIEDGFQVVGSLVFCIIVVSCVLNDIPLGS